MLANTSWLSTREKYCRYVPVFRFNTPVKMRLACVPVIGTQACWPIGAHMARSGGTSVKMVESSIRMTARFRPFRPRFKPPWPDARWATVGLKPAAVVYSYGAKRARLDEWCAGSPLLSYRAGPDSAAWVPSKSARRIPDVWVGASTSTARAASPGAAWLAVGQNAVGRRPVRQPVRPAAAGKPRASCKSFAGSPASVRPRSRWACLVRARARLVRAVLGGLANWRGPRPGVADAYVPSIGYDPC